VFQTEEQRLALPRRSGSAATEESITIKKYGLTKAGVLKYGGEVVATSRAAAVIDALKVELVVFWKRGVEVTSSAKTRGATARSISTQCGWWEATQKPQAVKTV
jgi:hypothetical protein